MPETELTQAYALHQRPYRETSVIVDFVTVSQGCVRAVHKGVRGSSKNAQRARAALQPFAELSLSWSGDGELKTLRRIEPISSPRHFQGKTLYAALYVNELLVRLSRYDAQDPGVYRSYKQVLDELSAVDRQPERSRELTESALRRFELGLLQSMGYEIDLRFDCRSGQAIEPGKRYCFEAGSGFFLLEHTESEASTLVIPGEAVLAIADGQLAGKVLYYAKQLTREALRPLLAGRPLKTRELFT